MILRARIREGEAFFFRFFRLNSMILIIGGGSTTMEITWLNRPNSRYMEREGGPWERVC